MIQDNGKRRETFARRGHLTIFKEAAPLRLLGIRRSELLPAVWRSIPLRRNEVVGNWFTRDPVAFSQILELLGSPQYLPNALRRTPPGHAYAILNELCEYFGSSKWLSGSLEDDFSVRPDAGGQVFRASEFPWQGARARFDRHLGRFDLLKQAPKCLGFGVSLLRHFQHYVRPRSQRSRPTAKDGSLLFGRGDLASQFAGPARKVELRLF